MAGNRNYQLYAEVKAQFERIVHAKAVIDTERALENCVQDGLTAIRDAD